MSLTEKFIAHIQSHHLFTKKDKLLVAVSGGVDSIVLCKLCSLAGYNFAIVHCNFQLRNTDSDRDELFVKNFAAQLQVECYSKKFNTKDFAAANKLSTQEAARILRYEWFKKVMQEQRYDYLLTAHHADDNVETVAMNFFRGTGIKGLTGIPSKNNHIIRPLLFAKRKELETFLHEHGLTYVQDESNFKNDYTRNFFRNTILPQIAKVYPDVADNLSANIERMKEVEMLYRQAVDAHLKKIITAHGDELWMPVLLLQKTPAVQTLLFEVLKKYGFTAAQIPEVMTLMNSESGRYITSATHRILKNRKHLIVSVLKEVATSAIIINAAGSYSYAHGTIILSEKKYQNIAISASNNMALLDASKIKYPLILRPWQTGDYFYPLGMQKKKKLSRFFIDNKLSLADKEKVWVIEMDKKIIWVVGHRIDDRFKITAHTQQVLQVEKL